MKRLTDLDYSGLSPDVIAQSGVLRPPNDHLATGISPSPVLGIESDRTYGLANSCVVGTTQLEIYSQEPPSHWANYSRSTQRYGCSTNRELVRLAVP